MFEITENRGRGKGEGGKERDERMEGKNEKNTVNFLNLCKQQEYLDFIYSSLGLTAFWA